MSRTSAVAVSSATESRLVGVTSALATVTIWAAWLIVTRYAMTSDFTAVDIGLLRFVVPFVLLAPIWLKRGIWPKGKKYKSGAFCC